MVNLITQEVFNVCKMNKHEPFAFTRLHLQKYNIPKAGVENTYTTLMYYETISNNH